MSKTQVMGRDMRLVGVSLALEFAGISPKLSHRIALLIPDVFIQHSVFQTFTPLCLRISGPYLYLDYLDQIFYLGMLCSDGTSFIPAAGPWRSSPPINIQETDFKSLLSDYDRMKWCAERQRLSLSNFISVNLTDRLIDLSEEL